MMILVMRRLLLVMGIEVTWRVSVEVVLMGLDLVRISLNNHFGGMIYILKLVTSLRKGVSN
jgi:hypothetical protein